MLYITIIIVAILIIGCIITCNYFNKIYNSDLYESCSTDAKLDDCKIIAKSIIEKLDIYNEKDEKDKYMYRVTSDEIYTAFKNIEKIASYNTIND